MKIPSEVWQLRNPFRRMAWAVLCLARYEVLEGGDRAESAEKYLKGPEAGDLLDLLGVNREAFLVEACQLNLEEA
jgi:hypothetical protein